MTRPDTVWVIGAGGLLGSAVRRRIESLGRDAVITNAIPWGDEDACTAALDRGVEELAARAGHDGWQILWCAGTGTPAAASSVLDQEGRALAALLDSVGRRLGTAFTAEQGALFLASSAGAVYAGSGGAPHSELTEPVPLSSYGVAKLAHEALVRDFSVRTGVRSLVGRISNLYGPGQNLRKPQGVITHLCRAHLTGQPISIYVSMDTIRDYLFVDDCAAKIVDGIALLRAGGLPDPSTLKVLATQQGTTLGAVIAECRRIWKRAPRVILAPSPLASVQARDLRLLSRVATEIDLRTPPTPLGVGISATADSLAVAYRAGALLRPA
ncbi:MAG: NAD-dependent epimerase/dehydratase family protein [Jatrophihabitans sp.]|uniref:NAD-dependent epimerase/dehydratase family protein n=1 Tax=Jatrophihabitans sp. TaxID=1932789 RepID=UPI003F7D30CE